MVTPIIDIATQATISSDITFLVIFSFLLNRIDIFQPYARPVTAPTYDFMPVKRAIFILSVYCAYILTLCFTRVKDF